MYKIKESSLGRFAVVYLDGIVYGVYSNRQIAEDLMNKLNKEL